MKKYTHPITAKITPENWKDALNPSERSLEDLIDIYGDLKGMGKMAGQVGGFIKELIYARMPEGETEYASNHFEVEINERERAGGLNKELILEEMGDDWVEEHTKEPTEYTEMRIRPIEKD